MSDKLKAVFDWAVGSTLFKKYSGIIGAYVLGLWTAMVYWRQINATLAAWGVERQSWLIFLLAIAAASGVTASIGLSLVKSSQIKAGDRIDAKVEDALDNIHIVAIAPPTAPATIKLQPPIERRPGDPML